MDECRADKQEKRERIKESRYNREYERCMTEEIPEHLGERVRKKEMMERENRYWTEGEECAARRKRQLSTRNERKREWGEILNKDGREIGWMKLISKRGYRIEKEGGGSGKKNVIFFLELFL
jgi:hypothetical protein